MKDLEKEQDTMWGEEEKQIWKEPNEISCPTYG